MQYAAKSGVMYKLHVYKHVHKLLHILHVHPIPLVSMPVKCIDAAKRTRQTESKNKLKTSNYRYGS